MKLPKYYIMEIRDTGKASLEASTTELITCGECKHRDEDGFCGGRGWPMQLVPDDGFCDKGKRSEE